MGESAQRFALAASAPTTARNTINFTSIPRLDFTFAATGGAFVHCTRCWAELFASKTNYVKFTVVCIMKVFSSFIRCGFSCEVVGVRIPKSAEITLIGTINKRTISAIYFIRHVTFAFGLPPNGIAL
jgi:hypothetical protein